MAEKFHNKYRIPSTRLQHWDYAWDAAYFVTICTKNREHFFGEIVDADMQLSGVGIIADVLWYEIKNHAKNIELGEFVVMPNHIHGIIVLNGNDSNDGHGIIRTDDTGAAPNVENADDTPPEPPKTIGQLRFQQQGKNSLSSIVGAYKSAVTKHANRLNFNFAWQSRFHDHIIRDEKSFQHISTYIINNPRNWPGDRFYK